MHENLCPNPIEAEITLHLYLIHQIRSMLQDVLCPKRDALCKYAIYSIFLCVQYF